MKTKIFFHQIFHQILSFFSFSSRDLKRFHSKMEKKKKSPFL